MEDRTAPHVGDRYVPSKIVWRTPLGPVWVARDQVLGRQVYIQTVEGGDQHVRTSFRAAAAALARVADAGVAQVYDIGSDPPFAVFENPGGGRLTDRLRGGPLPEGEAARIALGLARALEALHRSGMRHGSVRPDVVLLDAEGRAKLLALDVTGAAEQPPGYRAAGATTPEGADAYALAALTWHMVTGRPPPASLPRKGAGRLDGLLRRALDPDPARRPTLDAFIGQLGPHARISPSAAPGPSGRAIEVRWLAPAVIILALAILAGTVGVDLARDLADRTAPEPTPTRSAPPTATPHEIVAISDLDPEGDDRRENPDLVDLAVDGDRTTAWRTVRYTRASLGGKSGVGLLVDLGEARPVGRVQILTERPGWTGEIHASEQQIRRPGEATRAALFTATETTNVRLPAPATARWVVVWITQLVEAGDGGERPFVAEVAEVRIFAT